MPVSASVDGILPISLTVSELLSTFGVNIASETLYQTGPKGD